MLCCLAAHTTHFVLIPLNLLLTHRPKLRDGALVSLGRIDLSTEFNDADRDIEPGESSLQFPIVLFVTVTALLSHMHNVT